MGRDLGTDGMVDHFTLDPDELELLRNKTGPTRLGFSVLLKYLLWKGHFPRGSGELPDDAVEHVATQIGVAASDLGRYDFTGRQVKNHRAEIRRHTGFRKSTVKDAGRLTAWLAQGFARTDQRPERVRAELLAHCKNQLLEPPAPDRVRRIVTQPSTRHRPP